MIKQKVAVNFWIDQQAREAASHYTSIFRNAKTKGVLLCEEEEFQIHQLPDGLYMSVNCQFEGQRYITLDGDPAYRFNDGISLIIGCENQDEIDYFWESLSIGGDQDAQHCGWLKDKFGMPWQILPYALHEMMSDTDVKKTTPVMREMLKMKKIDLAVLKQAYESAA